MGAEAPRCAGGAVVRAERRPTGLDPVRQGTGGIQLLGPAGGTAGQAALAAADGRVVAAGGAIAGGAFSSSGLLLTRYLPK